MNQVVVSVTERSAVAEARRRAGEMVRPLAFDETDAGKVALCVTELATNLVKHAGGGRILMRALAGDGATGVEVLSIDCGPGMASVAESLRDGMSTAGSPGNGLGSLARSATQFEIFSRVGEGTAMRFELWPRAARDARAPLDVGVVCIAKPGEEIAGDAWALQSARGRHVVLVADGLGHGPDAAAAARTACDTLARRPQSTPAEHMLALHEALRPTRGAAGGVAALSPHEETGTFCGVGNIRCVVRADGKTRNVVSHSGTLGHQLRKVQEFAFPFPTGALLLMHSDGIATHWNLESYPGLEMKHPALIAAVLFRDFARGNDDATVVAVRVGRGGAP